MFWNCYKGQIMKFSKILQSIREHIIEENDETCFTYVTDDIALLEVRNWDHEFIIKVQWEPTSFDIVYARITFIGLYDFDGGTDEFDFITDRLYKYITNIPGINRHEITSTHENDPVYTFQFKIEGTMES